MTSTSLITFLSSLTGCRGVRGRSLHPGRTWSGGLWSTQEPRFETLSFPAGRVQSKNNSVRMDREGRSPVLTVTAGLFYPRVHWCRKSGTKASGRSPRRTHPPRPGSGKDLQRDGDEDVRLSLNNCLQQNQDGGRSTEDSCGV